MTETREDERIRSAMNRTMSGLDGNPYLARRVIAASEGEGKVKKKLSFITVLVIALILISVTALALQLNIFGWNDFFSIHYDTFVPETAKQVMIDSGEQEFALGNATFTVRDLYCDGHIAMASAVIRLTTDGILCGDDFNDPIGANGENGKAAAERMGVSPSLTWVEAAKEKNLPLYSARAILDINEEFSGGDMYSDPMYNEDGSLTYFSCANLNGKVYGETMPARMFLRIAQVNPDDLDHPFTTEKEYKDIQIMNEAPIEIREYQIIGGNSANGFTLESVKAEHADAGVYLFATFRAPDGASEDDAYDTLYYDGGDDCTDADGKPLPAGLSLSESLNVEDWPLVTLEKMFSANTLPEEIHLKIEDTEWILKLKDREQ